MLISGWRFRRCRQILHRGYQATTRQPSKPQQPSQCLVSLRFERKAALTISTKLLAFPEALKDADAAIKLDPSFVKAYIRKALVQQGMKDNTAALETLQKGTEADVEKQVSQVAVVVYQQLTDSTLENWRAT